MREQRTASQLSPKQLAPPWLLHTAEKGQEETDTLTRLGGMGVGEPSQGLPSGKGKSFCCI